MKRFQTRRLAAESLENRVLLAGDITASISGGVLRLAGDAEANGVLIRTSASGLEVVGTAAGGEATTINGQTTFSADGVTKGLVAWLGEGNDSVSFGNANTVTIPGTIVVGTAGGNDSVSGSLKNGGSATFHLGAGADQLSLNTSVLGTVVVNGDPFAAANGGIDQVSLTGVRSLRGAVINTGAGNDIVDIGGGSSFPLSLTIATGDGADRVDLEGTTDNALAVGHALTIFTGRGNDVVNAQHVKVNGVATVVNLAGNAQVTLDDVDAADGLFAWLGAGDDSLTVRNSATARAAFGGGTGADTLSLSGNIFARLHKSSF